MKKTLKYKINILRQYLGYYICSLKPSAGLPSLMRLSLSGMAVVIQYYAFVEGIRNLTFTYVRHIAHERTCLCSDYFDKECMCKK
jgi:hypothetical protein